MPGIIVMDDPTNVYPLARIAENRDEVLLEESAGMKALKTE